MEKRILAVIIFCCFGYFSVLSGCASIVGKSSYPVTINGTPSHANITITDDMNKKIFEGYDSYYVDLERGVSGWYVLGNIAFGGLIGWFIVDPLTGAMWTFPSNMELTIEFFSKKKEQLQLCYTKDKPWIF